QAHHLVLMQPGIGVDLGALPLRRGGFIGQVGEPDHREQPHGGVTTYEQASAGLNLTAPLQLKPTGCLYLVILTSLPYPPRSPQSFPFWSVKSRIDPFKDADPTAGALTAVKVVVVAMEHGGMSGRVYQSYAFH